MKYEELESLLNNYEDLVKIAQVKIPHPSTIPKVRNPHLPHPLAPKTHKLPPMPTGPHVAPRIAPGEVPHASSEYYNRVVERPALPKKIFESVDVSESNPEHTIESNKRQVPTASTVPEAHIPASSSPKSKALIAFEAQLKADPSVVRKYIKIELDSNRKPIKNWLGKPKLRFDTEAFERDHSGLAAEIHENKATKKIVNEHLQALKAKYKDMSAGSQALAKNFAGPYYSRVLQSLKPNSFKGLIGGISVIGVIVAGVYFLTGKDKEVKSDKSEDKLKLLSDIKSISLPPEVPKDGLCSKLEQDTNNVISNLKKFSSAKTKAMVADLAEYLSAINAMKAVEPSIESPQALQSTTANVIRNFESASKSTLTKMEVFAQNRSQKALDVLNKIGFIGLGESISNSIDAISSMRNQG